MSSQRRWTHQPKRYDLPEKALNLSSASPSGADSSLFSFPPVAVPGAAAGCGLDPKTSFPWARCIGGVPPVGVREDEVPAPDDEEPVPFDPCRCGTETVLDGDAALPSMRLPEPVKARKDGCSGISSFTSSGALASSTFAVNMVFEIEHGRAGPWTHTHTRAHSNSVSPTERERLNMSVLFFFVEKILRSSEAVVREEGVLRTSRWRPAETHRHISRICRLLELRFRLNVVQRRRKVHLAVSLDDCHGILRLALHDADVVFLVVVVDSDLVPHSQTRKVSEVFLQPVGEGESIEERARAVISVF